MNYVKIRIGNLHLVGRGPWGIVGGLLVLGMLLGAAFAGVSLF